MNRASNTVILGKRWPWATARSDAAAPSHLTQPHFFFFPQIIGLLERFLSPPLILQHIYIFIYISYVTKLNTVCLRLLSNDRLIIFSTILEVKKKTPDRSVKGARTHILNLEANEAQH